MRLYLLIIIFMSFNMTFGQSIEKNTPPDNTQIPYKSTMTPDRVVLTFGSDAEKDRTVTWRTQPLSDLQYLELAEQDGSFDFYKDSKRLEASKQLFVSLQQDSSYFHTVKLIALEPGKVYSYRVGGGAYWSPWYDFKIEKPKKSFKFIYLGDAQNDLYTLWSRVVHQAYEKASDAAMILHVGDLINHSQNDYEWAEWFDAASPMIHRIPQVIVPGNHEYIKDENEQKVALTPLWNAHFNFPTNGPKSNPNQAYFLDYDHCRLIMLNSNEAIEEQANWLENILKSNKKKWLIVMFHHPVISGASGRINEGVMKTWKPLLDQYGVDLVLQGHDHVYGRGNQVNSGLNLWDENSGTVYVVSVAGRKMYPLESHPWMDRKAENLQTFQVINVEEDKIYYEAFKTNGELFDAFEISKTHEGLKEFIDKNPTDETQK
ncbi:metallophosphoesterase family protein [Belliella sp. DSM 111904]|uniref:Metallophosphoesterase family protein n=1 Tax=Belliella filtrata TaxID=2923435 RepID=A0ABS9V548_9BACT|nr:metallophosphoesterase family protein [Belliella filtrata]MCH7411493.1 metallophosphoesterase family protein [Belliella filtrata]